MMMRGLLVYIAALAIVRLGDKRFMGRSSPIDMVMAIVVGSVLSRAVNGQAPVFRTLGAVAFLFFLYWLMAFLGCQFNSFSALTKGKPQTIIRDGQVLAEEMRRNHIEVHDLHEALRLQGKVAHADEVAEARLERNGQISVIKRKQPPQVLAVGEEGGVLTMRIKITQ